MYNNLEMFVKYSVFLCKSFIIITITKALFQIEYFIITEVIEHAWFSISKS